MRAFVVVAFLLLCALGVQSQNLVAGTYRQCDTASGDETILDIGFAPDRLSTYQYTPGACGSNYFPEDQFTITATFDFLFEEQRADGGYNVVFNYRRATVVPETEEASEEISNICNSPYPVGVSTNVLGCLLCSVRFNIYRESGNNTFDLGSLGVLGARLPCSSRPSVYENVPYELIEVAQPSPSPIPEVYSNTFDPYNGYINQDDDADDDLTLSNDEDDDAEYLYPDIDDDDEGVVITISETTVQSFLRTFSNSPFILESGSSSLAFVSFFIVLLAVALF